MKGQFFPYGDENPTKNMPLVNYALIFACVAVFLWSLGDFERIIQTYGFTPVSPSLLTLFASMFLHGGLEHIFGNMWYLYIFGDNVEDKFGKWKYILFYLLSGIAATFLDWFFDPLSAVPRIGASGAISGVLGAYIVMFSKAHVKVLSRYAVTELPAFIVIGLWFVIQLLFGVLGTGGGIAFWAHVGGFIFGYIATKMFYKPKIR